MMDRLKDKNPSDDQGELVTRADGSQALRVKKRKRRTNQTEKVENKANQRSQILQIAGAVLFLFAIGLTAGIGLIYANSLPFRESLIEKIGTETGAKASLNQFRINPSAANAAKITLEWPEGNVLEKLIVSSCIAKISPLSFLGNNFSGEELVAGSGQLFLKSPKEDASKKFFLKSEETKQIDFNRYSVPKLNIFFASEKDWINMLRETEASFYTGKNTGQGEIRLTGGTLNIKNWPKLTLDRSYIKVRDGELQIQSLRFNIPASEKKKTQRSSIDFSGTIKPLDAHADHTLSAELSNYSFSHLLGSDLGTVINGLIETSENPESNFLTFNTKSSEQALLEVAISGILESRIELVNFPFLNNLSNALNDTWYQTPVFEKDVTATVRRRAAQVELIDLKMIKRGRIAISGSMKNAPGGRISGTLSVGLPDATIQSAPNERIKTMFGEVREGYRWIDLEISGTGALPDDNFLELYKQSVAPLAADPVENSPDSFDNLIGE